MVDKLTHKPNGQDAAEGDTEETLRMFGVASFWLLATGQEKSYKVTKPIYSVQKELHKVGHQWTVYHEDYDADLTLTLKSICIEARTTTTTQ